MIGAITSDWNMNELPNDVLDIIYKMKFQKEYKLVMDDIRTKFVYKDVLDELTRTSLVMAPFIECETGDYYYYPLFDEGTKDRMRVRLMLCLKITGVKLIMSFLCFCKFLKMIPPKNVFGNNSRSPRPQGTRELGNHK